MSLEGREVIVYGLYASDERYRIRYVGQTVKTIDRRLSVHLDHARRWNRTAVHRWINSVHARGAEVLITRLSVTAIWNETEQHLIDLCGKISGPLLNLTLGGEGCLGYKHSEEWKAKQALRMIGNTISNKPKSEAWKQKMRKPKTEAHKQAISEALRGRQLSDTHRQNLSKARLKCQLH